MKFAASATHWEYLPQIAGGPMPRHAANSEPPREVIHRVSHNGASAEISVKEGIIEVRNLSDPGSAVVRYTPAAWQALLECAQMIDLDQFCEEKPNDGSAAKAERTTERSRTSGARSSKKRRTGWDVAQWALERYVSGNDQEHQRVRNLILTYFVLTSARALLTGAAIALAHTGMPPVAVGCIAAAGTVLFGLSVIIMTGFGRLKSVFRRPSDDRPRR